MALRDDIATDAQAAWFDTDGLAQTVIYTQPARELGTAAVETEIQAVVVYGENPGEDRRYAAGFITAIIPRASIALPRKDGDFLTIAGTIWRVRKIKAGDGLEISWELECTSGEQAVMKGRQ
jgi:hypothetical protein